MGRQGLETERPQEEGHGQLLHHVHEHQKAAGQERGPEQGRDHAEEVRGEAAPERAPHRHHVGRQAVEA